MSNLNKQFMFLMMKYEPGRLPRFYQEVEYLQSTGSQWIDTGYVPTLNTKIILDMEVLNYASSGGSHLFGSRTSPSFSLQCNTSGTIGYAVLSATPVLTTKNVNNISLYEFTTTYLKLNNEQVATFSASPTGNNSLYLFGSNNGGTPYNVGRSRQKIKNLEIIDNNITVRNLVPCYRKSDHKPGMYDLINNVFYVNKGTDADFLVGPKV